MGWVEENLRRRQPKAVSALGLGQGRRVCLVAATALQIETGRVVGFCDEVNLDPRGRMPRGRPAAGRRQLRVYGEEDCVGWLCLPCSFPNWQLRITYIV